jgi:hypothetical protein
MNRGARAGMARQFLGRDSPGDQRGSLDLPRHRRHRIDIRIVPADLQGSHLVVG